MPGEEVQGKSRSYYGFVYKFREVTKNVIIHLLMKEGEELSNVGKVYFRFTKC